MSDALEPNVEAAMEASPRSASDPRLPRAVMSGPAGRSKRNGRPAGGRIEEAEMIPIGFARVGKTGGDVLRRIRRDPEGPAKASPAGARSGTSR